MKKLMIAVPAFLFFSASHLNSQPKKTEKAFSVAGKKVQVYTTAEGTDFRLTLTETLSFANMGQPVETQPCVFVDPSHSFQTLIGIGGALTDASAETFAKLPEVKQMQMMNGQLAAQYGRVA